MIVTEQSIDAFRDASGKLPDLQACPDCARNIPVTAKKCAACGYVKRRLSWLTMTQTTLSLLVALVSVSTAAIPVLAKLMLPREADPRFTILEPRDGGGFELDIINRGRAAMALSTGELIFWIDEPRAQRVASTMLRFPRELNSADFRSFKSRDERAVVAAPPDTAELQRLGKDPLLADRKQLQCAMRLHFASIEGNRDSEKVLDCNYDFGLLLAAIDGAKLPKPTG